MGSIFRKDKTKTSFAFVSHPELAQEIFSKNKTPSSLWSDSLLSKHTEATYYLQLNRVSGGQVVKAAQMFTFTEVAKLAEARLAGQPNSEERAQVVGAKVANALNNGDMGESRPPLMDATQLGLAKELVANKKQLPEEVRIAASFSLLFLADSLCTDPQKFLMQGGNFSEVEQAIEDAMVLLRDSIELFPRNVKTMHLLATTNLMLMRSSETSPDREKELFTRVAELSEKAVSIDETFGPAYGNLAVAKRSLGDSQAADRAWEKAIAVDPALKAALEGRD